jgi:signal transduction histidine kinase/ActR/RegA family two-component response regulator
LKPTFVSVDKYRPRSLFRFLSVLPVAIVLPALVLAGALILLSWQAQRAEMERDLQQSVRTLAAALDRELAASLRELERVAEVGTLAAGDLAQFRTYAASLVALRRHWSNIVLLGPDGRQRLNVAVPPGAAVPADDAAYAALLQDLQPAISDLFRDPLNGQLAVAATVPVVIAGERWRLIAHLDHLELSRFLADLQRRTGSLALVVDRQRRVVARNQDAERYLAQPVPHDYEQLLTGAPSGIATATSLDGVAVIAAWEQLPWGWTVVSSVPRSAFSSPLTSALIALFALGLGLLAASVLATMAYSRRIAGELRHAGEQASRLAAGEPVSEHVSGLVEIDALLGDLREASARLSDVLTELRTSESIARQRLGELEVAHQRKDEFLAMLAHELRNPLAPISTAAEMLKSNQVDARTLARAREVIVRQVVHLTRLVDDLLDVSRLTQGKIVLSKMLLDLRAVLSVSVNAAVAIALPRKQTINVDTPDQPIWIDGDLVRLTQVVDNLLGNALKYSPAGSTVDVRLGVEDAMAVLTVRDEGIGISPDMLERVFEVFVQGDESLDRAGGGLGLGLTLVRELAQLHGGSAQASSSGPGTGATFTVRLPLSTSHPDSLEGTAQKTEPSSQDRQGRILVVDDNRDAAEGLAWILERDKHQVRVAFDGRTAVRMAREFKPHIVLLDIGLPVMNGYQVAEQLRSFPETYRSVVIAITGYGQASDRERALQSGFDFHLVKPAEPSQVRRMVAEALQHSSDESRPV